MQALIQLPQVNHLHDTGSDIDDNLPVTNINQIVPINNNDSFGLNNLNQNIQDVNLNQPLGQINQIIGGHWTHIIIALGSP
jgi:hypothetical protein